MREKKKQETTLKSPQGLCFHPPGPKDKPREAASVRRPLISARYPSHTRLKMEDENSIMDACYADCSFCLLVMDGTRCVQAYERNSLGKYVVICTARLVGYADRYTYMGVLITTVSMM